MHAHSLKHTHTHTPHPSSYAQHKSAYTNKNNIEDTSRNFGQKKYLEVGDVDLLIIVLLHLSSQAEKRIFLRP